MDRHVVFPLFGPAFDTAGQFRPNLPAFCYSLFQSALNEKHLPGGAVAVVEDGRILGDFPLDAGFTSIITLRHLLTHPAGFDERVIGYVVRTTQEIQSRDAHLRDRVPQRSQAAGVSISYSNQGGRT